MRLILALALSASLGLSGCSVWTAIVTGRSAAQAAPQTISDAEKGLALAHLAYNGLGTALIAAAQSHVLHGSDAVAAKGYFDKAGDWLALADKADDAANVGGIVTDVTNAQNLIAQADAIIHPPKAAP